MIKCKYLYDFFFHICVIRYIHKVREKQHQNLEFDHTQGDILKKYINIQWGFKFKKISILVAIEFHLVFLFS
jgi:hypothetical protein